MKIVIIGFRGCGKSAIARSLAKKLRCSMASMDEILENQVGISIENFVDLNGWKAFRDIEFKVAASLQDKTDIIIDTGGGVVERKDTMYCLCKNAFLVWVDSPLDLIIKRLNKKNPRRPLLSEKSLNKDIEINYQKRKPLYEKYSQFKITNSNQPIISLSENIYKHIHQNTIGAS